jgi:hypothetical protein
MRSGESHSPESVVREKGLDGAPSPSGEGFPGNLLQHVPGGWYN